MRGTTEFKNACLNDTAEYRVRVFVNFTGSHDMIGGPKWVVDNQSPDPVNFPDISQFILGQFKIVGSELEGVLSKNLSRKVNFNLKNNDRMFDYKVFSGSYDPANNFFNGPYDTDIFTDTGKKIGNIRSGRLVIVQVGVLDKSDPDPLNWTWLYLDKFRGRLADWSVSQNDRQVQVTVEDERIWYQQIEAMPDVYIGKRFEEIFYNQCVTRFGFAPADVIVSNTLFVIPYVYIPDLGDTVWAALEKLSEVVAGKIDLDETGKIRCFSRLYQGDDSYSFSIPASSQDLWRILDESTIQGANDILSTTKLFNQALINEVKISSKPLLPADSITKVWKFKVFYNEDDGRNEGYLKPNRFFGDVWAYNTVGSKDGGPVKAIDRSDLFNTGAQNEHDKTYKLKVTAAPVGNNVAVEISDLDSGIVYSGTMTCDGINETHLGAIHPNLANVYVILESAAKIISGDEAELQIGIKYYAEFGDFRVYPNGAGTTPLTASTTFSIVSAKNDPGNPADWTDEKTAATADNGGAIGYTDRVVMALADGETNWDTGNVFYKSSLGNESWKRVQLLIVNRANHNRYVKSIEIFGRRIVESKNLEVTVKAKASVISAFGGTQRYELSNNLIPNISHAQILGKFITDNYCVPRDIPKVQIKRPLPYLQSGDRVKIIDTYTFQENEYIIRSIDETYSTESISQSLNLREADKGLYNPANSYSDIVVNANEPVEVVGDSIEIGAGDLETATMPGGAFTWTFDREPAVPGSLKLTLTASQTLKTLPILTAKYATGSDIAISVPLAAVPATLNTWEITYTITTDPAQNGIGTFTASGVTILNTQARGIRKLYIDTEPPAVPGGFSFFADSQLDYWLLWSAQSEADLSGFYIQIATNITFTANVKTYQLGKVFELNLTRALKGSGVYQNFQNGTIYARIRSFDTSGLQSNWTSALTINYGVLFANYINATALAAHDYQTLLDNNFFGSNVEMNGGSLRAGTVEAEAISIGSGERNYTILNMTWVHDEERNSSGAVVWSHHGGIRYTSGVLVLVSDSTKYWNIYGTAFGQTFPQMYDLDLAPGTYWLYARTEIVSGTDETPLPNSAYNRILASTSRRTGPTAFKSNDFGLWFLYWPVGMVVVSSTAKNDTIVATSYGFTYISGNHITTGTIDANQVNIVSLNGAVTIGNDGIQVKTGLPGTPVAEIGWLDELSLTGSWTNRMFFGGANPGQWKAMADSTGFLVGTRPLTWVDCDRTILTPDSSEFCVNSSTGEITVYAPGSPSVLRFKAGLIGNLRGGKDENGAWYPDVPPGTIGVMIRGDMYWLDAACNAIITPQGIEGSRIKLNSIDYSQFNSGTQDATGGNYLEATHGITIVPGVTDTFVGSGWSFSIGISNTGLTDITADCTLTPNIASSLHYQTACLGSFSGTLLKSNYPNNSPILFSFDLGAIIYGLKKIRWYGYNVGPTVGAPGPWSNLWMVFETSSDNVVWTEISGAERAYPVGPAGGFTKYSVAPAVGQTGGPGTYYNWTEAEYLGYNWLSAARNFRYIRARAIWSVATHCGWSGEGQVACGINMFQLLFTYIP